MSENKISAFNSSAFLKAIIPSYFFPFVSSGLPGYFLDKSDLMHASYSTIALPSLLATMFCFALLSLFQKRQIFLFNRPTMTFILGLLVVLLATIITSIFQLETVIWNIVPSAFIGAAIVTMTKPLVNITYNHE